MATSVQSGPYEILLRFNCEIGEKFGLLRGCHRLMAGYVVDDDSGLITGKVDGGLAADFPADELAKYLGEQFAVFAMQLKTAQDETQSLRAELEALRS